MTRLCIMVLLVALAGPVRCTTYEENTLNSLQTLCADGTRAVSTWSPTLRQWQTTITPPAGSGGTHGGGDGAQDVGGWPPSTTVVTNA
jgi:hypothetical protein